MTNRVSYTLDSTLDSVNHAESRAREVAALAGFSEDEQFNIAMAVQVISPLGLPGLKKRSDAWKLIVIALAAITVVTVLRIAVKGE